MMSLTKYLRLVLLAALLCSLVASSPEAKVVEWQDASQNSKDLFLLGFGELTAHYLDVSGNKDAFEAANPNLSDEFSTDYRFSLFANGTATGGFMVNGAAIVDSRIADEYRTVDPSVFRLRMSVESTEPIWDDWRFTGKGLYDPARQWEVGNLDTRLLTQPQEPSRLELLMRLESEDHGLIEGGSIRPSFENTKFTLHQRSIFGVYANLHTGAVGVEAVGGKLEGKAFRQGSELGIRADGTSGPYYLDKAPITRGSETVKIQVRDRFDESTILETRTLVRDVDYNVDPLLGKIILHQPVASETITSDPVYIVITFDYLREENDEIFGGRAKLSPVEGLQVSGSYLHRNVDDNATGDGIDEPEDLIAADASLKIDDHTTAFFEVAGNENPGDDEDYMALRVGAETEVIDNLKLNAEFQTIDDQFRSFTNSDLDPTKNQRRLHLGGDYQLTEKQKINASFANLRGLEENGEFNTYDGERDEKILSLGYRNDFIDKLGFGVGFERRQIEDVLNAGHEETTQNRAKIDVFGKFENVAILGDFGYKANFEHIAFRNDLGIGDPDANTDLLALSVTSKPNEMASIEAGQRFSLRKDKGNDLYDERQDASFVTVQFRPHTNLNTLTTAEYLKYTRPGNSVQLWQDDPYKSQWSGTFAIEYLPLNKIKAIGKAGRHNVREWFTDSTQRSTTDFVLGQVTYFHTHHLSFDVESEYRREAMFYGERVRNKTWDLGLKTNWNRDRLNEFTAGMIRRWQLRTDLPGSEITSSSYIVLASGSVSITRDIFGRASIKSTLLRDALNDEKTFTKLELGYDSRSWYRLSVGYERIESDMENYTGQGAFIRLSGKM